MALEKYRGARPFVGSLGIVIGAGRSGRAAARLLRRNGIRARLLERNPEAISDELMRECEQNGIELISGPHKKEHFAGANLIVPSPGVKLAAIKEFLPSSGPEIMSEMELSWRFLKDEPILAITGTSGKTTTASLAAAMLKAQGYTVFLGGNIGTPLAEYALDSRVADVLVLECSSFQLQGCSTFCPRVGILLNISPNHLDYHKDMAEYIEAKFRLFRCQDKNDLAILGQNLRAYDQTRHLPSQQKWLQSSDNFEKMRLLGIHNQINAEAAWQGARFFGVSLKNAQRAATEFEPLPHRLEKVAEKNGALLVNDSKCTTVAALKVALEAFDKPVRLLCGGKFKGGDLASLSDLIRAKVKEVGLFGGSREHFEQAWQGCVPISWHEKLADATSALYANANAGDVILLAPATSSYDQYQNYMERGEDFRAIAGELQ